MPKIRLRASDLREQITYQTRTPSADEIGGDDITFVDGDTVFAKVESKADTRVFEGGQIESVVLYFVTVREAPITDALKKRLKWVRTGKLLEIQALEFDERNRATRFTCMEPPADN